MPYLFQGGRYDVATGNYIFDAHDYRPTTGQWLQRDPLGQAAGDLNIGRFVGDNPTNATDPSGLQINPLQTFPNTPLWNDIARDKLKNGPDAAELIGGAAGAAAVIVAAYLPAIGAGAGRIGMAAARAGAKGIAAAGAGAATQWQRLQLAAERLAGKDRQVIEAAGNLIRNQPLQGALSRLPSFQQHILQLGNATARVIPGGQVHKIGTFKECEVWGSLISRVGIAQVDGVTIVIRELADGTWEVIGRLF